MSQNEHTIRGMEEFYNSVASGYDEHMRNVVKGFDKFYTLIAKPIVATDDPIKILNLGCGTGTELKAILDKCPNTRIACVDISEEMLKLLKLKYPDKSEQIYTIHGSYETLELGENQYDYAVCALCLHHYPYERKLKFFNRVFKALKPGGIYIEGDFIATPQQEREDLEAYNKLLAEFKEIEHGAYHVDAPTCISTEIQILHDANFKDIDVIYKEENQGVLIGTKG